MLLRRLVVASCLFSAGWVFTQNTAETHSAQLPVRRVVLYKNGVGYFEHSGRVTGNQAVSIDFTSSQLDDVLQSLTALDLNGGRITGVSYNSTTPLDQQLKNIPLGLGEKPSTTDLYASLEGARVEVSGAGEAALSGRIVHYEIRSEKTAGRRGSQSPRAHHRHRRRRDPFAGSRPRHQRPRPRWRPAPRPRRISRPARLHAKPPDAPPHAAGPGHRRARHSRQLHQRSSSVEEHLSHRLSERRQQIHNARRSGAGHPTGMGGRRQHRWLGLGQRSAFARRRRAAELHRAALAAYLHAPAHGRRAGSGKHRARGPRRCGSGQG